MSTLDGVSGIVSYGSYIPYFRLDRKLIAATLGTGGGRGTRAVASYDEDTTSMATEASRNALAGHAVSALDVLSFTTTDPAYLDKTNATAIHAALGLPQSTLAADLGGSVRSSVAALLAGSLGTGSSLVTFADTRCGQPGSGDEAAGGDAAAAIVFGTEGVIAELVGRGHSTAEFLDRWRIPGESASKIWEERFGEGEYVPLALPAMTDALKAAGITLDQVDALCVGGVHPRAQGVIAKSIGVKAGVLLDDMTSAIGAPGAAQVPLQLVDALDRAGAGEYIVSGSVADGVDVLVWRPPASLAAFREQRASRPLARQIADGNAALPYAQFLTWKGYLKREPARRPDPDRPSGPASSRSEAWKFGFVGSRCLTCGTRHLPPARVCVKCQAIDEMTPERLADVHATIATFTIDRLAFSMSPPVVAVVVNLDEGGRFMCEMTDVDPSSVAIGQKVEFTFRRLNTAQTVHNYFWKARPVRS